MKTKILVLCFAIICLLSSFAFAASIEGLDLSKIISVTPATTSVTSTPVSSNATIRVQLNGEFLDFADSNGNVSNPKIINNRTMVPMRKIFETFKASVDWNDELKQVIAKTDSKEITLTIGSEEATIKDLKTNVVTKSTLDSSPVISENRTLVPIRFIAEGLDKEVGWDANQRAVIIIDFNSFESELKSKVPVLEKLFALNLSDISAYSSNSKIQGRLSYKDTEEDGNSENVVLTGNADIKVNENDDMEATINFITSGNDGQIMAALKEQKYDNFDAKVVLKNGKIYFGIKENGEYKWTEASDSVGSISVPSAPNTLGKLTSYKDTIEYVKSLTGELSVDTYQKVKEIIDSLSLFINDDTIKVAKDNVVFDFDLVKIIKNMSNSDTEMPISALELVMNIKIKDNKISSETLEFSLKMNSLNTLEDLDININIQTDYKELEKSYEIKAPVL